MAMYTSDDLTAAQRDSLADMMAKWDRESTVNRVAHSGMVAAATGMWGFVNGYFDNPKVVGPLSVDLFAGLLGTLAHIAVDIFDREQRLFTPRAQQVVEAVTTGALSSYMNKLGTGYGASAKGRTYPGYTSGSSLEGSSAGSLNAGTTVGALSPTEAEIYVR